jgi:hypothetical protein
MDAQDRLQITVVFVKRKIKTDQQIFVEFFLVFCLLRMLEIHLQFQ